MALPELKKKTPQAPNLSKKQTVGNTCVSSKSDSNQAALGTLATVSKPVVDHFENDLTVIVFSCPVTLQEAKDLIWKQPPHAPDAIVTDDSEERIGDRQTRFNVNIRLWLNPNAMMALSDSVQALAFKNLPVVDPVRELEKAGLPHEIALIAPTLKYETYNMSMTEPVPWYKAMDARGCTECHPARILVGERQLVRLYRFPGIWTVNGKKFTGDWLVQNRHGIIEAWQLKPDLDAYIEALNGDEDKAKKRHDAAKQTESYVLRYWEEGHPLDDAMGLMRWEVDLDFRSAVWQAAGGVQMAAGAMSRRTTLEESAYSNAAIDRANKSVIDKYSQSPNTAGPQTKKDFTGYGRLENQPIPVSPERGAQSARTIDEPPPNVSMPVRPRETENGGERRVTMSEITSEAPPRALPLEPGEVSVRNPSEKTARKNMGSAPSSLETDSATAATVQTDPLVSKSRTATTGDTVLDKEIDTAFDKLEAGKGTGGPTGKFDPAKDPHAGPGVRVPVDKKGNPANVLDVGAGSKPTDLGLPREQDLVAIERSDINQVAHIQHVFDATKTPPPALLGKMDALLINNPRGYTPNIAELGKALKPNGRIIVQGRARIGPASPKNTKGFNPNFQALIDDPAPAGFRKIIERDQGGLPPASANTSADILGGPFYRTEGDQRVWPNARVIFERMSDLTLWPATTGDVLKKVSDPNMRAINLTRVNSPVVSTGGKGGVKKFQPIPSLTNEAAPVLPTKRGSAPDLPAPRGTLDESRWLQQQPGESLVEYERRMTTYGETESRVANRSDYEKATKSIKDRKTGLETKRNSLVDKEGVRDKAKRKFDALRERHRKLGLGVKDEHRNQAPYLEAERKFKIEDDAFERAKQEFLLADNPINRPGGFGEYKAAEVISARGGKNPRSIQNASGQGLDLVYELESLNGKKRYGFAEAKEEKSPLSIPQKEPVKYVIDKLNEHSGASPDAKSILNEVNNGTAEIGEYLLIRVKDISRVTWEAKIELRNWSTGELLPVVK